MGNQNSNEAQSSQRFESSSKEESDTWEDLVVQIKVKGLSRSNSMEGVPEMREEYTGSDDPQSSMQEKSESKGECRTWDDLVSNIKGEGSQETKPSWEIKAINEELETGVDGRASYKDKDIAEENEVLEVSSMPGVEGSENLNQAHTPREVSSQEVPLESHDFDSTNLAVVLPQEQSNEACCDATASSDRATVKQNIPRTVVAGKNDSGQVPSKIMDADEVDSSLQHQMLGTDAYHGKDGWSESKPSLNRLLEVEGRHSLSEWPLKHEEKKHVSRSKSLLRRISSLTGRRRHSSRSFSMFSCGSHWPKEDPVE